jgi:predicted nucleic acid-binding protein
MPDLALVYWDANVFLSYVNGIEERLPVIDVLLNKSGRTDLQIITSALSIVEVAFAKIEQDNRAPDEETEAKITALWEPRSPVQIVEFYPLLAMEARALIRQALPHGWSLKPLDAMHLATARRVGAEKFHTYDDGLAKFAEIAGFPIGPPAVEQEELPYGSPPAL